MSCSVMPKRRRRKSRKGGRGSEEADPDLSGDTLGSIKWPSEKVIIALGCGLAVLASAGLVYFLSLP